MEETGACDGCGICVKECPYGALSMENEEPVLEALSCTACGICAAVCPQKAV